MLDSGKSELYHGGMGYDGLNRLTAFARGTLNGTRDALTGTASRRQNWSLDPLGNWDSVTDDGAAEARVHDSQNRLLGVGASTLAYSPNGEMTTDEEGNVLKYDGWGRLVSWDNPYSITEDGPLIEVAYEYDALYRRIERSQNGAAADHSYYSSQWQVLEERNAGGTPIAQYVWSPVYVDAMILRDTDGDADGDLTEDADERVYVLHDANFNITALAELERR